MVDKPGGQMGLKTKNETTVKMMRKGLVLDEYLQMYTGKMCIDSSSL